MKISDRSIEIALLAAVFAAAIGLRLLDISQWSLWEDEETTIYFSQNLGKPFPSFFPVFFAALGGLYRVTGISITAGRLLSTSAGLLGIAFAYAFARRHTSWPVAILAAGLLSVNLGHLFWCQSIRYYTTVVALEIVSVYFLLDGLERKSYWALTASNASFALAMLTHFSAILFAPVVVGYLVLAMVRRERGGAYSLRGYLSFALPFLAILAFFTWRCHQLQAVIGGMVDPSARDPVHVLVTVVAYFGVPLVGLAFLTVLARFRSLSRFELFCVLAAFVPVAELAVLAQLGIVNVTWYYGLVALVGFAVLAAMALVDVHRRGYRRVAAVLGVATGMYYGIFLLGYYTTMHGDRPRWQEAVDFVARAAAPSPGREAAPEFFSSAPGVVAYYLGVPPRQTMESGLVQALPDRPPPRQSACDQWYIIESRWLVPAYAGWLKDCCEQEARFEARTGPVDRSVIVYLRRRGGTT